MNRSYKKQILIIIGSILLLIITSFFLYSESQKKEAYDKIQLSFIQTEESYEIGSELNAYEFIKSTNAAEVDVPKINTSKTGEFSYIYIAYDAKGNHREFGLILNFVDPIYPVLTLTQNEVVLTEGDSISLKDYIAEAYDPVDGKLKVTIQKPENYKSVGTHDITYQIVDNNGNETKAHLKLVVKEKTKEEPIEENNNNNAQNGSNGGTPQSNSNVPSNNSSNNQTYQPNTTLPAKQFLFSNGYTMPGGNNSAFGACTQYKGTANGGCYPIIGSDGLYIGVEYIP